MMRDVHHISCVQVLCVVCFSEGYHTNTSSYEHMRDVLVITMHSFRNYSSDNFWKLNTTVLNTRL